MWTGGSEARKNRARDLGRVFKLLKTWLRGRRNTVGLLPARVPREGVIFSRDGPHTVSDTRRDGRQDPGASPEARAGGEHVSDDTLGVRWVGERESYKCLATGNTQATDSKELRLAVTLTRLQSDPRTIWRNAQRPRLGARGQKGESPGFVIYFHRIGM